MEFWGLEVKPGEKVSVDPGSNKYLHLSQVSLGEVKKEKGNENVPVFLKFDEKKLVLGTLSAEKCPQISYDLVFEKEFELSHNSKNTSVYFCGYKTDDMGGMGDYPDSDEDSEEEAQPVQKANGKSEVKVEKAKPTAGKANAVKEDASAAKPKAKAQELSKSKADEDEEDSSDEDESDDSDDSNSERDDSEEESESDEIDSDANAEMHRLAADGRASSEEDDSSDEDEEATPVVKADTGKKRAAGSASKTPVPEKKAKLVTPIASQKTGGEGKKGVHTATPHPAKKAGKVSVSTDKAKQQTPKSAGSVTCKSCNKSFNSDGALQAHTKAKHSAAK